VHSGGTEDAAGSGCFCLGGFLVFYRNFCEMMMLFDDDDG